MSDLGPEARSILKAGRDGDDPRPSDRARLRRKISRAIAAGGAIGAASAAGSAAGGVAAGAAGQGGSAALLFKVFGGVILAGAVGAGLWVASAPRSQVAPAPPSVVVSESASAMVAPAAPGSVDMPS